MPASQAREARRSGFTLVELLVASCIMIAVAAIAVPVLGNMRRGTAQHQFRAYVEAALQYNTTTANMFREPDADGGFPRLPGIYYSGTAVVFDNANSKIWFENNFQGAADSRVADATAPGHWIANQTYAATGPAEDAWPASTPAPFAAGTPKRPYKILPIEPLSIPSELGVIGVWRDTSATPSLKIIRMPFAVCCGSDAYGLPSVPVICARLDTKQQPSYVPVPVAYPSAIVYTRDTVAAAGYDPDTFKPAPGTGNPAFATDEQAINWLLSRTGGRGSLVQLNLQSGTLEDTP